MTYINDDERRTIDAMHKYGGSFVKTLAELCEHADAGNYRKIKATWPQYFEDYSKRFLTL